MTAFQDRKGDRRRPRGFFLPTSPNITTGYVVEVESDEITELDEDVEDALLLAS